MSQLDTLYVSGNMTKFWLIKNKNLLFEANLQKRKM